MDSSLTVQARVYGKCNPQGYTPPIKRRSILQAAGAASAITVATAAAMTKGDPKKIAQLPVLLSGPDKLTVSVWMMPGDEHRVVARRPRDILAAT